MTTTTTKRKKREERTEKYIPNSSTIVYELVLVNLRRRKNNNKSGKKRATATVVAYVKYLRTSCKSDTHQILWTLCEAVKGNTAGFTSLSPHSSGLIQKYTRFDYYYWKPRSYCICSRTRSNRSSSSSHPGVQPKICFIYFCHHAADHQVTMCLFCTHILSQLLSSYCSSSPSHWIGPYSGSSC